jgi:prepilin-type N-terminal cleavage/methylation domain-containing protein
MPRRRNYRQGFTLIELSIVLVVIGLIAGGIFVGQSLINAAETRATISQIEKYNTAVNTFRGKYGYLPGDMPNPYASQFGFVPRGQTPGEGDGDGLLEGIYSTTLAGWSGIFEPGGETGVFWVDLTTAGLIDGNFHTASETIPLGYLAVSASTTPNLDAYFPQAKLGKGNYIYVWSGFGVVGKYTPNLNYYGLSAVTSVGAGELISNLSLPVQQAYGIDKKTDDGLPQSGRITAQYVNYPTTWQGTTWIGPSDTSAAQGTPTTCYDNGGIAGATQQYSMGQNGGAGVNCALSFEFQ